MTSINAITVAFFLAELFVFGVHGQINDPARTRTLKVYNKCPVPVMVKTSKTALLASSSPIIPAGSTKPVLFHAAGGSSGRLWGQTGCIITLNHTDCETSAGNFHTLFEWTFTSSRDWWDISAVDGINLPMAATPVQPYINGSSGNCSPASCGMDVVHNCPPELKYVGSRSGVVTCSNVCGAINSSQQRAKFPYLQKIYDNAVWAAQVCCRCNCGPNCGCGDSRCIAGCPSKASTGACIPSKWPLSSTGLSYIDIFKKQCSNAYVWAYDDFTGTKLCKAADYAITFCPDGKLSRV